MPRFGESIRLNLQLWDGATNKYVRAYLYNSSGASIGTVDLEHVANGLYSDSSVVMPMTDQVRAVYRVFSDSAHTVESVRHSDALEVFDFELNLLNARAASLIGIIGEEED